MNPKSHRWQKSALALATAAFLSLSALDASALALGSVVVQSALGEPLRAEIDIPEINAEEAASLKASLASPEAFRAAGLEFNAALTGVKVTLQRRANGRAYIRLVSDKPVTEPFVDMILEASWATGRIVRDYTMLFDPPNLRVPATPVLPATPSAGSAQTNPVAAQSVTSTPIQSSGSGSTARPAATAKPGPRPAGGPPVVAAPAGDGQVTVRPGDTAGKIAASVKPATVSLDQMLVALLRANPEAFINSNINRIKAGAVMNVPTAEQAQAIGTAEARQTVIAQSRDFGDFRKKLASGAPTAQVAAADRKSGGTVQGSVDDKKPGASAPDKLTLSKGAIKAAEAEKIAKERATKDAATRAAEVAKNMSDLAKLGATAAKPGASAVVAAAAAPVVAYTPPAMPASVPGVSVAATTVPSPAPAPTPTATASAPAASVSAPPAATPAVKPAVKPAPIPMPVAEPSLIDELTENPLVPAAGVGLVALLGGFAFYRSRQRKKAAMEDSAFLESRLQPDSFFGASGGQKVDTNEGAGGSSMVYTPSQLDAADDVDPVAEADVYLAYGRDIQAEEILKEALKFNPGRIAIHHKLLEIYAKRKDLSSFESAATDAYKVTGGEGADWTRVCDMGLTIDATNSLYMPGGAPAGSALPSASVPASRAGGSAMGASAASAGLAGIGLAGAGLAGAGLAGAGALGAKMASSAASSFGAATTPLEAQPGATAGSPDLSFDLDLDFSLDEENANVIKDLGNAEKTSRMGALDSGPAPLDMNFDSVATKPMAVAAVAAPVIPSAFGSLEFELPQLEPTSAPALPTGEEDEFKHQAAVSFGTTVSGPLATFAPKAPAPAPEPDNGMLEFDLGSLSLDLNDSTEGSSLAQAGASEDPLATKLSLAEEFSTIGDDDGARALIEEVIAESSGDMRSRAQAALARLS